MTQYVLRLVETTDGRSTALLALLELLRGSICAHTQASPGYSRP